MVNPETGTLSPNNAPRQRSKQPRAVSAAQWSIVLVLTLSCLIGIAGCGGVQGTYTDATGSMTLELKSGGAATFSFMGQTAQCTYVAESNQVTVDCHDAGGKNTFTVQKDGSLTGPPGSFFPPLKKK